jgi:hypothetical protein
MRLGVAAVADDNAHRAARRLIRTQHASIAPHAFALLGMKTQDMEWHVKSVAGLVRQVLKAMAAIAQCPARTNVEDRVPKQAEETIATRIQKPVRGRDVRPVQASLFVNHDLLQPDVPGVIRIDRTTPPEKRMDIAGAAPFRNFPISPSRTNRARRTALPSSS